MGPRGTPSLSFLPDLGNPGKKGRKGLVTPWEWQPRAARLLAKPALSCSLRKVDAAQALLSFHKARMTNTNLGREEGARKHNHLPVFGRALSPNQQTAEPSLDLPNRARHRPGPPRKLTWAQGQSQLPGDAEAATHVCTILPGPRALGTPARRALGGDSLPTVYLLPPPPWHTGTKAPLQCTKQPLKSRLQREAQGGWEGLPSPQAP